MVKSLPSKQMFRVRFSISALSLFLSSTMVVQQILIPRAVGSSPICSAKYFYWEVSSIGKSRGLINLWLRVQAPCFPFITYKVFRGILLFRCVDRQIYYRVYGEYKSSSISYQCSSALF